ncbi:uncharacterized protein METZ01_LOCUS152603, partial [marine metagenome]
DREYLEGYLGLLIHGLTDSMMRAGRSPSVTGD